MLIIAERKSRKKLYCKKILFDFKKNRKYNYNERVAGERKSSFPAARFFRIFAKKKCAACPRKSSLYDKVRAFLCHRKLRPTTQKRSAKDRTAAEWKSVAKATRRRRRILQAGFFFMQKREELKQNGRK